MRMRRQWARQGGIALLVVVFLLSIAALAMFVDALSARAIKAEQDRATREVLVQARDALVGYALSPALANVGQLPTPDVLEDPVASGNYDGDADSGCLDRSKANGHPLIASGSNSRCLGRLPWRTLAMSLAGATQNDPSGVVPWYAVSANLVGGCIAAINPGILNLPASFANCLTSPPLPYPWLTVRDGKGNVLSNRVAFVLIMPGPPVAGQIRTASPLQGASAYLDVLTVLAGCAAPCVPGTHSNAAHNPGNNFIVGADDSTVSASDPSFGRPYQFNDKLLYATIDEFMAALERRALGEAANALAAFYKANGYYPYAAPLGTTDCVAGTLNGLIPNPVFAPTNPGCLPSFDVSTGSSVVLATWFSGNNWQKYVYYAVSSDCTQTMPAPNNGTDFGKDCGGPGRLTLGTGSMARPAQALLIGIGRPVRNVAGQTPSLATPPYAASKGADQTGYSSSAFNDYLDSSENANGDTVYDAAGTARSSIYNDQMWPVCAPSATIDALCRPK